MAINKNSNLYTIVYTVVMVVIVGTLLAVVSTSLKDLQDANVLNEQKVSIMKAAGNENGDFDTMVAMGYVDAADNTFYAIDTNDTVSVDAVFKLLSDRKALAATEAELPIFIYNDKAETTYIIPLVGKGLWGDIWGYAALQTVDGEIVVKGIVMDHAGETPGLGAEIATDGVQNKFVGKLVYAGSEFALRMQKGGAKAGLEEYQVDAITGGTKTCDGVNDMLRNSIDKYKEFLENPIIVEPQKVKEE